MLADRDANGTMNILGLGLLPPERQRGLWDVRCSRTVCEGVPSAHSYSP